MVKSKDGNLPDFEKHSVTEFFKKNREMLGYTGPIRSLTTAIHEAVTNSIDAAEENEILPDLKISITKLGDSHYRVMVEDNGPGIPENRVEDVFGKMLAGTKFDKKVQSRGQQGIGISGVLLYSQATTGKPMKVTTSTGDGEITEIEVEIDEEKNRGKTVSENRGEGEWRGTRLEFEVKEAEYRKSKYGVERYLRLTSLANPHVQIEFEDPKGEIHKFDRVSEKIPPKPDPILPHPDGIEVENLMDMTEETSCRTVGRMLKTRLGKFSNTREEQLQDLVDFHVRKSPSNLSWKEGEEIISAFEEMDFYAPNQNCLQPIGEENMEKELEKIFDPDFSKGLTRSVEAHSGGDPFQIEIGIVYGGDSGKSSGLEVIRFANKVPLLFNQGSCVLRKAAKNINWKRYGIDSEKDSVSVLIHIASTRIPYDSAGKQSVAEEESIREETEKAVKEAARHLRRYLKRKEQEQSEREKEEKLKKYHEIIEEKARDIVSDENVSKTGLGNPVDIDPELDAEEKLKHFISKILNSIENGDPPEMEIPSRNTPNIEFDEEEKIYTLTDKKTTRSAENLREVEKLAETMCVINFCMELFESDSSATLRELYYTSEGWPTGGFESQDESDRIVEDIESSLNVKREDLGLLPEEDGASIYGDLTVKENGKEIKATEAGRSGYTIPPTLSDVEFVECGAERILAVETMGMYHRLVQEEAWDAYDSLIVSLKGQPARATRRFLKRANNELNLPIYLFTDGDPFGFHIAMVVISGSIKLAYINHELAVPEAQFIGVTASDIEEYELPTDKLREKDEKRLKEMLDDPRYSADFWQKEINKMLELEKKAEQQAFTKHGLKHVVEKYLPKKLGL